MTIAWKWDSLSAESRTWAQRFTALIDAGFDRNQAALRAPKTIAIDLFGISAADVVGKIKRPEILHNDPLVRAIVDGKLGAAHAPDELLGSGRENTLTLTTIDPTRAIEALKRVPQVAAVHLA